MYSSTSGVESIDHSILIENLRFYGIRGNTLALITDYFTGRQQYTEVEGEKSDVRDINYGVIQGGVLATLLFVIYVNDIGKMKARG